MTSSGHLADEAESGYDIAALRRLSASAQMGAAVVSAEP